VEEGGGGGVLGSGCTWSAKAREMGRVLSTGAAGQKREGKRAGASAEHDGGEVAASRSFGGRGTHGRGSREGEHDRGRGRATRGVRPSRRWHR
jgi:hypothetical protein